MKQRFSSLDVKVIAHELQESLVSFRLANVYDLSSKILLLKFAKPDNKKQLVIDSGFRCHLTDFARTTAAAPSPFVARLRKFLKTRRLTSVSQIGTDRILEFQFSDGQYRLYLEFFASGNVILTDSELKILSLLRNVPEGEGQEPQRVGLSYSLENRQNYRGIPSLTKERLREALESTIQRNAATSTSGKKFKTKPGEELKKSLATTITELPPILVDHSFQITKFDPTTKPSEILEKEPLLDGLLHALMEARKLVEDATSSATATGYIFAKLKSKAESDPGKEQGGDAKREDLLYEDFHPFLPQKFANDPSIQVLTFDGYNKTVDEFFSSLEGQKLESKLTEREAAAKRKIDAARQDQAKRVEGLQGAQLLNLQKAAAIETNVERVQEAMDAVSGLLQQGMDWVDINKLVEREQKRQNPVAEIIKLPLKLADNIITLLIGEEEDMEDEDEAYETDSDVSDDGVAGADASKHKAVDKTLEVDINLGLTPWANAREFYDQKRTAAVKQEKTLQQSTIALTNQEKKINEDLRKGLKQEKAVLIPIRRQLWFEKFIWFLSSDGYLVLGGKDAQQNEILYKRYLRKGDVYCHADLHGAASVIIKNNPSTPDAPIPPSTLSQAGTISVCSSNAWDSKAGMSAWWVNADQVSKSAPTGEFLPTGSFMVRGKKNFLPPAQLLLGLGIVFKISEQSKAKHLKHRLETPADGNVGDRDEFRSDANGSHADEDDVAQHHSDSDEAFNEELGQDQEDEMPRDNPLQRSKEEDHEDTAEEDDEPEYLDVVENLEKVQLEDREHESEAPPAQPEDSEDGDNEEEDAETEIASTVGKSSTGPASTTSASTISKKGQPKRGQKGKAKKIAAKYKHQDEEDRAAAEAIIGATVGRQKIEEEEKAKAQKEAELVAAKERRRAQHQKSQKETAEHEEIRRVMQEEGVELLDADEAEKMTPLDALVGTPLVGDEILEAIPVCAPWNAMAKVKYKAKLQPGTLKKGKVIKEVLERWRIAPTKKGVVDEQSRDPQRMWPREVELLKALKPEEVVNCVPVGKVKLMMAGGTGSAGGAKGGQGKGGSRGGKGSKRK